MIGIIGYGTVGQAVANGFPNTQCLVCDPKVNNTSIKDICKQNPLAIFVCVPTDADDKKFSVLLNVLDTIKESGYQGLTVVKSTALPEYLQGYDIVYNPEFLTRGTYLEDFINPVYVIIGGSKGVELLNLYNKYSIVNTTNTYLVDIPTAALIKYTMNTFFALKVTYMNSMYEVAKKMGADYNQAAEILSTHPWMGSNHFKVPGPDGKRGFGGPCLPKDTQALNDKYKLKILEAVIELNKNFRHNGEDKW